MTSYQDNIPFIPSSPKLPAISTGGLVTGSDSFVFKRPSQHDWAGSLRRQIEHSLKVHGRTHPEDIAQLHRELVKLFISALQPNAGKEVWLDLNFALVAVEPYATLLSASHGRVGHAFQTQHYVERIFVTYQNETTRFYDVPVVDSLRRVFPNELAAAEKKFEDLPPGGSPSPDFVVSGGSMLKKRAATTLMNRVPEDPITNLKRSLTMELPDGRNPFHLIRKGDEPEKYFRPKPLTVGNMSQTISMVASQMAAKESMWKEGQSSTVAALATELPPPPSPVDTKMWIPHESTSVKDFFSEPTTPVSPRKPEREFKSITGREAVSILLAGKHLNQVKFMYFNVAENRHYRPYDLVSVPEDQIQPEHYIFSTFGVLHVHPDGSTSETMSLADWNRRAVLWGVISKIGFFKKFLICRSLKNWRQKVRRQRLSRARTFLRANLLQAVPEFGSAFIHVFRLVGELLELQMLPRELPSDGHFGLDGFITEVQKKKCDAEHMLEVFFRYCKKVVDVTRQECFDQLKHCEYQVRHARTLFSKESIYLQRKKQQIRAANVEKAKQTIRQLSSFITLVDQVISVHLLEVLRMSVRSYIRGVISPYDELEWDDTVTSHEEGRSTSASPSKEPQPSVYSTKGSTTKTEVKVEIPRSVFFTKLIFNSKTCALEMYPSTAKFKDSVCTCIGSLIAAMCDEAHSMNISGKPSSQDVGREGDSVGSAPSSTSRRSSVASLSSELDAQNVYDEPLPPDVEREGADFEQDVLADPNLSSKRMPTKEEDEMGVATPNLVASPEPGKRFGMMVDGEGVMGQFNPLNQSKLRNKLIEDPEIKTAVEAQNEAVESALREVEAFCNEHNQWLVTIRSFTSKWSEEDLAEWKGKSASDIENMLNKIKSWNDSVKNLDRSLIVGNRLLFVDCRAPQLEVAPALSAIFKQLIALVASEAKALSLEVTLNSKEAVKVLENKNLDMASFAAYARKVTECLKVKDVMMEKVTYIKQLYEVVRMTHRQLTHEEEKLDEKVKNAWEAFVFQLKDATNFVSNQRPIILKQLEDQFKEKYAYVVQLSEQAAEGIMVDPAQEPSIVISELKGIISKFYQTRKQLVELSMCRESIDDTKFDLGNLDEMERALEDRLELWKYVHVSSQTITDWRNTLFRRFQGQAALGKIAEWQKAAAKLQKGVPENDPVLLNWLQTLADYGREVPLLQRMADEAIKTRHWKQIFTGMGESYEPGWAFTVNDLLSYKLSDHAVLISQVYHSAMAEYMLEQTLRKIKRKWEDRQFNLAKHIQTVKTMVKEQIQPKQIPGLPPSRGGRNRDSKPPASFQMKVVTQEKDSETYILVGSVELLSELSDSHVALQGMLQSRHAAEVQSEAEIWSDTLQQIGEIVNLWSSCQDKWMYLNRIFAGESSFASQYPNEAVEFEVVDARYREFIQAMINDPKVLSVLSRRHGQKGWRELQGENLRRHIVSCIRMEEELLSKIAYLLEEFRSESPRLYFLCDEDCIRLLSVSRQPRKLLPYVRKCFRGVKSLVFQLPSAGSSISVSNTGLNALDLDLHSHKLQVTHMQGHNGEVIEFASPLSCESDTAVWFREFEAVMKHCVASALLGIMRQRTFGPQQSPVDALDELGKNLNVFQPEEEATAEDDKDDALISKYRHWLLRFPSQITLLSESIFWTQVVTDLLKNGGEYVEYENVQRQLTVSMKQLGHVLVENAQLSQRDVIRTRLQATVSALLAQSIYHRDMLDNLQNNKVTSVDAFDWQRVIRHKMYIPEHEFEYALKADAPQDMKCNVEHLGESIAAYGLEYEGYISDQGTKTHPGMPTVMTPLTERSMFSLCVALQLGKCGTLLGPEASGKSAVVTQLARVFGRPVININCAKETGIAMLQRALCGMVESGSWLSIDTVHRLPVGILSVLSQQIRQIQLAYSILQTSRESQYTVRGLGQDKASGVRQRSKSISSLHHGQGRVPVDEMGTSQNDWRPEISHYLLARMSRHKEEADAALPASKGYDPAPLGSIMLNGRLLQARPNFGIFMMMTTGNCISPSLPHNLKLVYRPIALIKPDTRKIFEVWLQASGFISAPALAEKMEAALKMLDDVSDSINSTHQDGNSTESGSLKIAGATLINLRSVVAVATALYASQWSHSTSRSNSVISNESSTSFRSNGRHASSSNSEMAMNSLNEEYCVIMAFINVFSAKLQSQQAVSRLKDTVRSVFPLAARPMSASEKDHVMSEAIKQQMQIDGLQVRDDTVEKIAQLNSALRLNKAVIIVGPAGSGKTTMYRTLAHALNKLSADSKKKPYYMLKGSKSFDSAANVVQQEESRETLASDALNVPGSPAPSIAGSEGGIFTVDEHEQERIDMTVLFPNNLTTEDLFGHFDKVTGVWNQGMIEKILKGCNMAAEMEKVSGNSQQKPQGKDAQTTSNPGGYKDILRRWIILDGEITSPWIENINCLLDVHKSARLINMDDLSLNDTTNLVFEVTNFSSASPALISRCAVVNCDVSEQWHLMITTWLDTAYGEYAVTMRTIRVWRELVADLIPQTLSFLEGLQHTIFTNGMTCEQKARYSYCTGVKEASSFLQILESLLNLHLKREAVNIKEMEDSEERSDIFGDTRSRLTSITAETDVQSTMTYASSNRSRLDDTVPDSHHKLALNLFGFAFVWGFGGQLLEWDMLKFDEFLRKAIGKSKYNIQFPPYETVFEYFVEEDTGQFTLWEDKIDVRPRAPQAGSNYAFVHQIERYAYLSNILLKSQHAVLLMGEAGCGKSALVSNILQEEHKMTQVHVSQGLTSQHLQKLIESKSSPLMKQHNLGLMAHPNAVIDTRSEGKHKVLLFLDDLSSAAHVPSFDGSYAIQPTHELIRQIMTVGAVYDRERRILKTLEGEVNFLATATLPGAVGSGFGVSVKPFSPRMARMFTTIHFLQPSKDTILSIYHNAVQSWLEEFPAYSLTRHYDLSQAIIAGAVELYSEVRYHFRPTPRLPHYVFSLHDVSHIMQGLFLLTPRARGRPRPVRRRGMGREDVGGMPGLQRPGAGRAGGRMRGRGMGDTGMGGITPMMRTVIRVWLHECSRTFYDRLFNSDDRSWFSRNLQTVLKKHFCTAKDERMVSPGLERVKIVKTPIPSAEGTPVPMRGSTSTSSTSNMDGTLSLSTPADDEASESRDLESKNDTIGQASTSLQSGMSDYMSEDKPLDDESVGTTTVIGELTVQAVSRLPVDDTYVAAVESNTDNDSRLPSHIIALVEPYSEGDEQEDAEGYVSQDSELNDSSKDTTLEESFENETSAATSVKESTSTGSARTSAKSKEETGMTTTSSDTLSIAEDNASELESRPSTNVDTKTEGDEETEYEGNADESRSLTTAMTAELETDASESSSEEDSDEQETTTTGTPSSKAKSSQADQKATENQAGEVPGPSAAPQVGRRPRPPPARPGGAKLGVTFVPGLIDDPERVINTAGPLTQLSQVLQQNEDPTSIIFSKNILSVVHGGIEGYSESTEGQLSSALKVAQGKYNKENSLPLELVFFKQAVQHIARLSRVMSMSEGHAVLLSRTRFAGRRCLTRLVTYLCKCALFEVSEDTVIGPAGKKLSKNEALRKIMFEATLSAGLQNEPTVLMVEESLACDTGCLDDICSVAKEGQCPSLYTHDELIMIASEVMPGGGASTITTDPMIRASSSIDKMDHYLEAYFRRVVSNLHIVLLMPYPSLNGPHDLSDMTKDSDSSYFHRKKLLATFHNIFRSCPQLLTRFASIDLYDPWDHLAWVRVGEKYLEDFTGISTEYGSDDALKVRVPWPSDIPPVLQVVNLSHIMAHIHLDAMQRTKAFVPRYSDEFVTPNSFRTMVELFINVAVKVGRDERKVLRRYEKVLRKIGDADATMERYSLGRVGLLPLLDAARETERSWKRHVEQERREYSEAKQRCELEEEIIEQLEEELVHLRENARMAFDEVNPMYEAALRSMQSLSPQSIDEIKRYKKPPEGAAVVVKALCVLFNVTPSWDNGKSLLSQDNFYEDLEFYDKDHMPENVYISLSNQVKVPEFKPQAVAKSSKAAECLCIWMHSVHKYVKLSRYLAPKIAKMKEAEKKVKSAQATLGAKRVRCNQIKEELDSKIQQHKNASRVVRQYERDLKNLGAKMAKAQLLMGNLAEHVTRWRNERDSTLARMESAVGDSVLAAACMTYHGVLGQEQRDSSLAEWIKVCLQGRISDTLGSVEVPRHQSARKSGDSNKSGHPASPAVLRLQQHSSTPSSFSKSTDTDSLTLDDMDSSVSNANRPLALVRDDFEPKALLISESIEREWHRITLPREGLLRSNAVYLIANTMYQHANWPLIFDPDDQLRPWIKPIMKHVSQLRMEGEEDVVEEEKDSPFPSSGEPTSETTHSDTLDIYDDMESSTYDESSQFDDSYFDDDSSTVISVTSTSQTLKSGMASRKSKGQSSTKSKGVRFADDSPPEPAQEEAVEEKPVEVKETPADKAPVEPQEPVPEKEKAPPLNITICEADSSSLNEVLKKCVQSGSALVITHMERAPFPIAHQLLLLRRRIRYQDPHHSTSTEKLPPASSSSVKMETDVMYPIPVNPKFRLFLSIGVDVSFIGGYGFPSLPMSACGCVNFSLEGNGLKEKLLQISLAQERPEFENQRKLLEADIFHLEEQMDLLRMNLLVRVSGIQGAILNDSNLLDDLRDCKRETIGTKQTLVETRVMETNLLKKRDDLIPVSEHGAALYQALSQTAALRPDLYYWTPSKFVDLFIKALHSRMRGKSSLSSNATAGAGSSLIKARVAELNLSVLESLVQRLKRSMYESDVQIFTTYVSLEYLHNTGKMSREEIQSLLLGAKDGKNAPASHKARILMLSRPKWVSEESWEAAKALEMKHYSVYAGLLSSLSSKASRWNEYLSAPPVLVANVPCEKLFHLSIGQKALLWKTLRPDAGGAVISNLGSCVLGVVTTETQIWNVRDILARTCQTTPVIFMIPEEGTGYQPTMELAIEAKHKSCLLIESAAPFSNDLSEVLVECMVEGHWLVLHNCELAKNWPDRFLSLLHSLTYIAGGGGEDDNNDTGRGVGEEVTTRSVSTITSDEDDLDTERSVKKSDPVSMEMFVTWRAPLHQNFRLWLITKSESDHRSGSPLPSVLLQHAEIINLQLPFAHRALVQQKYRQISAEEPIPTVPPNLQVMPGRYQLPNTLERDEEIADNKQDLKLQLSLLHAILHQRRAYEVFEPNCPSDAGILDVYRFCLPLLHTGNMKAIVQMAKSMLKETTFDFRNWEIVKYFIGESLVSAEALNNINYNPKSKGASQDLANLYEARKELQQGFNALLPKANMVKLDLARNADKPVAEVKSLKFLAALNGTTVYEQIKIGVGEKFDDIKGGPSLNAKEVFVKRRLESLNAQIPQLVPLNLFETDEFSVSGPLNDFYRAEFTRLRAAVGLMKQDITIAIRAIKGLVEINPTIMNILEGVYLNCLPTTWTSAHPEIFHFHLASSLSDWVEFLQVCTRSLMKYSQVQTSKPAETPVETNFVKRAFASQTPTLYNLGTFLHPDIFLRSFLAEVAKSKFQDANKFKYRVEIASKHHLTSLNVKISSKLQATLFTRGKGDSPDSVLLEGMLIRHGAYDSRFQALSESASEKLLRFPSVRLTVEKIMQFRNAVDFMAPDRRVYQCPVYLQSSKRKSEDEILFHVPLKCDISPETLRAQDVHIVTSISSLKNANLP